MSSPAGWYPDHERPGQQRYWDGQVWTEHRAPIVVVPAPQQRTNGLAIASMVLGILWLEWVGSILALIFGHVAISQINRSGGWQGGKGMAIAGVVLGYVGLAALAIVLTVAFSID